MRGTVRGRVAAAVLAGGAVFTAFGPPGDFLLAAFWGTLAVILIVLDLAAGRRGRPEPR
ncbi:MAG: hypothetical protein ACE148_17215 [Vicinamibacterales bacterium]